MTQITPPSLPPSRPNEGRWPSSRTLARDAMDAWVPERRTAPKADGEVVWSWPLDAEVKLAMMLRIVTCDGGKKARLTEEITK